jgi:hypothetical protein
VGEGRRKCDYNILKVCVADVYYIFMYGIYTITLRNNGSYHITVYELTVTEAVYNPCRFFGLFTNNAQVFYKSHSLASGGVGSVRNYRKKARRT